MEFRWLGRTGIKVSSLALGTMPFGAEADETESAAISRRPRPWRQCLAAPMSTRAAAREKSSGG
jgi:hypothetical protein